MIARLPIRARLAAAFAVAMAAVLAGSAFYVYVRLDSRLTLALDRDLRLRAQDLGVVVSRGTPSLALDSGAALVERGESYAQVLGAGGRVLDATRPLGRTPLLDAREQRSALTRPLYADRSRVPGLDEPSRLLATRVSRAGSPAVLVVGTTTVDRAETLASLRDELLVAGPVALLLATGVGYLLAGMSLRHVEAMRRRAAAISAATLDDRLPVPTARDELRRLAETLNEMLDRLEAGLERERGFVADAGHELRTPLAHLRTELELALRQAEGPEELREALRGASQEAERLAQLAEGLLLIARGDRGEVPLRLEDLEAGELLATIATRFEWRAQELGKAVAVVGEPRVRLRGDRLRLEQALGNLVDNALRYGGPSVGLAASTRDETVELHVRDDGPGFPAGFLDRAFERFSRPDAARSGGGAGLGLSIVRTIAAAHGGSVHASNGATAGADLWLSLPTL
jgi:two-component system OmpR family sensor kinase